MISKKMETALNEQVNAELYSSYLYLSMESYLKDTGLDGFANWMRVQAQEEVAHAMKIYDYIASRGGRANLLAIDAPPKDWGSILTVFEESLKHEQYVTSRINDLMNLAIEEKDHAAQIFLQWFVAEQVEEEESVGALISKLRFVGEKSPALLNIDRELAQRVFTPLSADK